MRVSKQCLDHKVTQLNRVLGRPLEAWRTVGGKNVAQVGNFHLDYNFGWCIEEMDNSGGGVHCPFGHHRMTSGEMANFLDAILAAVEIARGRAG